MARPISEVLTQIELERIESIDKTVSDFSQAKIVGNIGHIACNVYTDKNKKEVVQARVYLDSRRFYSPFMLCTHRPPSETAKIDYAKRANELLSRRRGHLHAFDGRPHERKAYEATIRGKEIELNRYYLHETNGRDPGLFVAAAHWIKEYSDMFCKMAEEHYVSLGVNDFSLVGFERAVVISVPENEGDPSLFVFAMSEDLTFEEQDAQSLSGLLSFSGQEYQKKSAEMRQKLEEAEEKVHLCILGNKGKRV